METALKAKSKSPFCHEWESLLPGEKDFQIRQKLNDLISHARRNSRFYHSRLDGFDPKAEQPLAGVPVLTSQDLRQNLPPCPGHLLTDKSQGFTVFQSGGTTGTPKTSLFTHQELELINECNLRGFSAVGLSRDDRVANLWAVGGLYMTFIHMNRILQEYGCMNFPFSNQTPVDFIHSVSKLFDVNCFTGITSVVLNTLREIDRRERKSLNVKKIFFGGEHIYEADRNEMREKFGVELIAAPGYGTIDSWYIGYQCSRCPNGVFHVFDDMVWTEILNEETGAHCALGEPGMLHVTVFPRRLTPVIRYRVGDRARWLDSSCPCGRTTPLFELLGRGDDVLRIGYDSIDYNFVQSLAAKIPELSGRIQIEKKRSEGKDLLIVRVETDAPSTRHEELAAVFEKEFTTERPSFREFVKKGTVFPLKVELLKAGALPVNPRTGKLVRVIDAI